jgi:hypothetical protein
MQLLDDKAQAEARFGPFGDSANLFFCDKIVLILSQDTCTLCAEHTIGSNIVLVARDATPR